MLSEFFGARRIGVADSVEASQQSGGVQPGDLHAGF
jgi:hypothetical protein